MLASKDLLALLAPIVAYGTTYRQDSQGRPGSRKKGSIPGPMSLHSYNILDPKRGGICGNSVLWFGKNETPRAAKS